MPIWSSSQLHRMAARRMGGAEALRHRVAAAEGIDPVLADDLERQAAVDVARGERAAAAEHLDQALFRTPPGPERIPRMLAVVEAKLIAGDAPAVDRYAEELSAGGDDPWWDYVAGYQDLLAGKVAEARTRFSRALEATSQGDLPRRAPRDLRARIATQLAIIGIVTLSYPEMIKYGEIADSSTDPRVSGFASFAQTIGLALAGRGRQALSGLDEPGTGTGPDLLAARGMVEMWNDDLDGAYRHLSGAVDRAADLGGVASGVNGGAVAAIFWLAAAILALAAWAATSPVTLSWTAVIRSMVWCSRPELMPQRCLLRANSWADGDGMQSAVSRSAMA